MGETRKEYYFRFTPRKGGQEDVLLRWIKGNGGNPKILEALKTHYLVDALIDESETSPADLQLEARRAILVLRNQIAHIGAIAELPEIVGNQGAVHEHSPTANYDKEVKSEDRSEDLPINPPVQVQGYDSDMGF